MKLYLFTFLLAASVGCGSSQETQRTDSMSKEIERTQPAFTVDFEYQLVISPEEISCGRPNEKQQSIRWDQVTRVWYVTTSEGPLLPDQFLIFEGNGLRCSVPMEAHGIEKIFDELKLRFPGFDFTPVSHGGIDDAKHLCWKKDPK
jgi:hypothetical protein